MVNEIANNLPYEAMFICPADVAQKDVDGLVEKIKKTLSESGAVVNSVQFWGRRRLAYPIKRQREGLYVYVDFSGNNKCAASLGNLFRVTDKVIRHLVVRKEEAIPTAPQRASAPEQISDSKSKEVPSTK